MIGQLEFNFGGKIVRLLCTDEFKMPLKSRSKAGDEKKKTVQTNASVKGMYKVDNVGKVSGHILINTHLHL